jgi:hypothetical protein
MVGYWVNENWRAMKDFALKLIEESNNLINRPDVIGQRIRILHLDHANELLMKSWLIKNGYVISYLKESDLKNGVKQEKILDMDRTMSYEDSLNLVSKQLRLPTEKKEKIKSFHKLRSEIQHRAINLYLDKTEMIENFYPIFRELYEKMYPDYNDFP